jgi:hypothetical protein
MRHCGGPGAPLASRNALMALGAGLLADRSIRVVLATFVEIFLASFGKKLRILR